MAGGSGTRFWPLSTSSHPKQYLSLTGKDSLVETTINRFDSLVAKENIFLVTIKDQEALARKYTEKKLLPENIIFEPTGRNTAPSILLSLATLLQQGAKNTDVVAVVPSDHLILNQEGFKETITKAKSLALTQEKIITIGIVPTTVHTGLGHIQRGPEIEEHCFAVKSFVEKPDFTTAQKYMASGEYYWNGGIFVVQIATLLDSFKEYAPQLYDYFPRLLAAIASERDMAQVYKEIPAISIDYAVMEKCQNAMVIPATFDWNDLGSWDALGKTEGENTLVEGRDSYFDQSQGNIVYAPKRVAALVGVKDLVVVVSDKAVLVIPRNKAQDVKEIVSQFKKKGTLKDIT